MYDRRGQRAAESYRGRMLGYRGLPPLTTPFEGTRTSIPNIVFETEGEEALPFDAYENTTSGSHFFPGYMLFTSVGDWVIETRAGDKMLGRAVLRVRLHT